MKKLLIIVGLIISVISTQAQGVKISAMPTWTDPIDSLWFPVINYDGTNWVNYRAQGWQIGKERIDSIINNWPAGAGSLFAVSGQDDQATQVRDFDQNGFIFTWGNGGYTTMSAPFTRADFDDNYHWFQSDNGSGTYYSALFSVPGEQISLTAGTSAGTSQLDLHSGDGISISQSSGIVYVPNLANTTTANVVYYNTSTGLLTYGAASGGGGGGSGIQSIEGNNGVTVLNDSTVQLGSATQGASTLTAIRYIDALTDRLEINGTGTYTFRATTTTNRAISGEASGAGIGVTGTAASGFAGIGVQGTGDNASATGVQGNSVAGSAVVGTTSTGWAGTFTADPSSTNTAAPVVRILRTSSGTAADGIGAYVSFWAEYSSPSTIDEAARVGAVFTSVSTRTSSLEFTVKNSNSINKAVDITGSGNLRVLGSGKALALTSPDGTVYYGTINNGGTVLSWSTTAP